MEDRRTRATRGSLRSRLHLSTHDQQTLPRTALCGSIQRDKAVLQTIADQDLATRRVAPSNRTYMDSRHPPFFSLNFTLVGDQDHSLPAASSAELPLSVAIVR
jgi:hypothetical protein